MKWYDTFVNCNSVATRWQWYSTHLHTYNTQNDTKQTIHRTTQKFWKSAGRAVFAGFTLAFALQLRKSTEKTSVRVAEECQLARWRYINFHIIHTQKPRPCNFSVCRPVTIYALTWMWNLIPSHTWVSCTHLHLYMFPSNIINTYYNITIICP